MDEGTFRLYRLYPSEGGSRLVARFVFHGTSVSVLEDHDELMQALVPNGRMTDRVLQRLESMAVSPYWRLVSEENIQQGYHDDLLPEVKE